MIELKTGDILAEKADALVNTVNCVGVMGRGIALQFKKEWPENFDAYKAACSQGEVEPGSMFVYETGRLSPPHYILNFPTKRHWRNKSRLEDLEAGLEALVGEIRERNIESVAIPPLGCGLGGLDWEEVRPRIEAALSQVPEVRAIVFEPIEAKAPTPAHRRGKEPKMTKGRAALVRLVERYLAGGLDPVVSLLEVQKLMYFMQEAGQPLRLRISKGHYGPYAENLRHVLNAIEGWFLTGYGYGGDDPTKTLELCPGVTEVAEAKLAQHSDVHDCFERVTKLVDGFESPFGLELLSTVHWVVTREGASTEEGTIDGVYAWNARKRQFSSEQILLARRILSEQGWIEATAS